jgi:hypothetical protein
MRPIPQKGSNSTPKMNKQIGPEWDCFSFIFTRSADGVGIGGGTARGGGSFWVSVLAKLGITKSLPQEGQAKDNPYCSDSTSTGCPQPHWILIIMRPI